MDDNQKQNLNNKGYLYKNKKKNKATQPDMTGKLNVEGEPYFISVWEKTGQNNEKYLSISLTKQSDMPTTQNQSTQNFSSPASNKPQSTDQMNDNSLSEINSLFNDE